MRRTSQIRALWNPACTNHLEAMRAAYRVLDAIFAKWGYKPRPGVTGAANCRKITGGSGWSLHAYFDGARYVFWTGVAVTMAVAVDVNWDTNPYGRRLVTDMPRGMIDEILAVRTVDGLQVWGWGGNYSGNKDAMHFELLVSAAELARGIRTTTQPPKEHPVSGSPRVAITQIRDGRTVVYFQDGGAWISPGPGSGPTAGAVAADFSVANVCAARGTTLAGICAADDGVLIVLKDGRVEARYAADPGDAI